MGGFCLLKARKWANFDIDNDGGDDCDDDDNGDAGGGGGDGDDDDCDAVRHNLAINWLITATGTTCHNIPFPCMPSPLYCTNIKIQIYTNIKAQKYKSGTSLCLTIFFFKFLTLSQNYFSC